MEKQILIAELLPKLNQMGIQVRTQESSDVVIAAEFLDAGWGTGNKKISYEASIFFDESSRTVFMWEMTKETGSGFSFGGDSESSFQSGATLFRKVKSIQYAPDGKAYEVSLDLGAIPKAFKETAKAHGWKFKTVLNREKASYPAGYVPPAGAGYSPPPMPTQTQMQPPQQPQNTASQPSEQESHGQPPVEFPPQQGYSSGPQPPQQGYYQPQQPFGNPENAFYAEGKKAGSQGIKGLFFWIPFGLLLLASLVFFGFSGSSIVGWVILVAMFALLAVFHKKIMGKGCLINIVLWFVLLVVLFVTFAFTLPNSKKSGNETPKASDKGEVLRQLDYTKKLGFTDGRGEYTFNLKTEDNRYKVEFRLAIPKTILPADFVYDSTKAEAFMYQEVRITNEDKIDSFLASSNTALPSYTNSFLGPTFKNYDGINLNDIFEGKLYLSFKNGAEIKDLASKYDKIQLYRYNYKQVGFAHFEKKSNSGGNEYNASYGLDAKKAYRMTPSLAETTIPWSTILQELGMQ